MLKTTLAALLTLASAALAQPEQAGPDKYTVIRCGKLLAVPGQPAVENAVLVAKNGVIQGVVTKPADVDLAELKKKGPVEEIDLSKLYVLPGLIDCHVHLTMYFDADLRYRMTQETDSFIALQASNYAAKTLDAGFTTVRDLGAKRPETIFALRDAINRGLVRGPRILAAGHPIAITGGHGDFTNGYRPDIWGPQTPDDGIADGPDECMKAVRNQIKLGADCIKLTATGGVLSASAAGLRQHFTMDELKSIVTAAHMMNRKVAAHAHGLDGISAAINAGVDSIEHGTYLDQKLAEYMGEAAKSGRKAYLVPTMLAAATVSENAEKPGYYLPMVAAKAKLVGPKIKEAVGFAKKAGVLIAFGTDTGVSEHGLNAREFKLLVDAGLTPTETIVSATITAAELLGLSDQVGTLQPGRQADLIAVAADPTADVTQLEKVLYVIKAGRIEKAPH